MSYEAMDALELREHRDYWRGRVCEYATKFLQAHDAGDLGLELGMRVALDQALAEARRIDRHLKLGVAA